MAKLYFKTADEKTLKEQSSKRLPSLATTTSTHSINNQLVVDSAPITFKHKAELLLSTLQDNPNMSWDEDGTVKLYGKPIQGSNIIDLVNDVVRQRKGSEPVGWQPFAEGLRELNIPQDVIGNRERWDYMHRSPNLPPRTPKEEFITPPPNQKRVSTIRKRASPSPYPKTNDQPQENSKANCFHLLQYLSRNNKSKNFIPHNFYLQRKSI